MYSVIVLLATGREIADYSMLRKHLNLLGMVIPEDIKFTADIKMACINKDVALFAVPSIQDVLGVELCEALKNIIALVAGMKRVITYETYDLLRYGHINLKKELRLWVII